MIINTEQKSKISEAILKLFGQEFVSTIILYGSSITGRAKFHSDIDAYVILNTGNQLLGRFTFENMIIEYHTISLKTLLSDIGYENVVFNYDRSLYSILTTGEIVYSSKYTRDVEFLIEQVKMNNSKKRFPRGHSIYRSIALEWYDTYYRVSSEDDSIRLYIYYNLLDNIRKWDFDTLNFDKIQTFRFQSIMNDPKLRSDYGVTKYPNQEYMRTFESALNIPRITSPYIRKLKPDEMCNLLPTRKLFRSSINHEIVIIANALEKVKEAKDKAGYYLYYYYVLLEKIRILYQQINCLPTRISCFDFKSDDIFLKYFLKCLSEPTIDNIENIFNKIISTQNIDLNNYCIKI